MYNTILLLRTMMRRVNYDRERRISAKQTGNPRFLPRRKLQRKKVKPSGLRTCLLHLFFLNLRRGVSGRGESLFLLFPTLVSLLPLFTSENLREVDVKKHISHTPAKIHYFFLICKKVRMNVSSLRLLLLISTSVGTVFALCVPPPPMF